MAFPDILGSLSDVGDNISEFFDSSLGQTLAEGLASGTAGAYSEKYKKIQPKDAEHGFMGQRTYTEFSPTRTPEAPTSKDFQAIEVAWLQRMQKFAGLHTGTEVKLGAK